MTTSVPPSTGGWESPALPLTWSAEASPASPSPSPAAALRRRTSGGSGRQPTRSFATYDPGSRCWRTYRVSLAGDSDTFSETWPRSGTTRSGTAFRRRPSVPLTDVTGSSFLPTPSATEYGTNQSPSPGAAVRPSLSQMARQGLWPTPTASNTKSVHGRSGGRPPRSYWPTPTARLSSRRGMPSVTTAARRYWVEGRRNLEDAVAMWPTPTVNGNYNRAGASAKSGDGLATAAGGPLNPPWIEWLMGFPPGWTDCGPSATP